MNFKKLLSLCLLLLSINLSASEPTTTSLKFYGYVGNEFFFNSRQNVEMVDGVIMLFPKPALINSDGIDVTKTPHAELLSVNSRLGIDINGTPILGAKSSGKIEADFAGTGSTFFVLRIRQAFVKLNWEKTELLLGQTWHPLFGNVAPTTPSSNGGAPFQPFNRSPQLRVKQSLSNNLSLTAAALYEMQYASQGSLGTSNIYLKNAIIPDLFLGLENKTSHWTTGIGIDTKTLKLLGGKISSMSEVAYAQYTNKKFTAKGKVVHGQNLSSQLMLGGYGVSAINGTDTTYTNMNTASGWLNVTYGSKIQVGILGGYSKNLATEANLVQNSNGKYMAYGYGFYSKTQSILNQLYRIAPHVSYNLPNLRFALEYDWTSASYGSIEANGKVTNPYSVGNHRALASVSYIF